MCGGIRSETAKRIKHGRYSESDKELWSILSASLEKKKSIKRKRSMDFYRAAVLEFSVQKLNDEITARCNRKAKRRRKRERYEWHDGSNGVGWNMKNTQKDDDDLLGIDDFFRKLSKWKPENSSSTETDLVLSKEVSGMDISE